MLIVHKQLTADLIKFILAEEEIILQTILAQGTIKRVGINLLLITQHCQGLLCPGTIENGFVQHLQILPRYIILAVDEVRLCQTFDNPGTLIVIRYGLHCLESEALRGIDQSEIEIDLS